MFPGLKIFQHDYDQLQSQWHLSSSLDPPWASPKIQQQQRPAFVSCRAFCPALNKSLPSRKRLIQLPDVIFDIPGPTKTYYLFVEDNIWKIISKEELKTVSPYHHQREDWKESSPLCKKYIWAHMCLCQGTNPIFLAEVILVLIKALASLFPAEA